MTLSEIRNDVGSRINQYDDGSDVFVSGFVTTREVDRWINQSFEDAYKWYALANSGRFSVPATTDTVEDQAVYTFGGDAEDLLAIETVMVKLSSTDDKYRRAYPIEYNDFIKEGSEEVPSGSPRYIERQIYNEDTGHYVLAIEFVEDSVPGEAITDGLMVRYIERPPLMTDDAHIPEKLPREIHKLLVLGASIPALEKMGEYDTARYLEEKYNTGIRALYIQDKTRTSSGVKTVKPRRKDIQRFYLRNS